MTIVISLISFCNIYSCQKNPSNYCQFHENQNEDLIFFTYLFYNLENLFVLGW